MAVDCTSRAALASTYRRLPVGTAEASRSKSASPPEGVPLIDPCPLTESGFATPPRAVHHTPSRPAQSRTTIFLLTHAIRIDDLLSSTGTRMCSTACRLERLPELSR